MTQLLEMLKGLIDMFQHFVGYLIQMFEIAIKAFAYVTECIAFLPLYLKLALVPIIAISIIMMIVNRS